MTPQPPGFAPTPYPAGFGGANKPKQTPPGLLRQAVLSAFLLLMFVLALYQFAAPTLLPKIVRPGLTIEVSATANNAAYKEYFFSFGLKISAYYSSDNKEAFDSRTEFVNAKRVNAAIAALNAVDPDTIRDEPCFKVRPAYPSMRFTAGKTGRAITVPGDELPCYDRGLETFGEALSGISPSVIYLGIGI